MVIRIELVGLEDFLLGRSKEVLGLVFFPRNEAHRTFCGRSDAMIDAAVCDHDEVSPG